MQLAKNIYAFVSYTANDPRILKSTNSAEVDKELRFAGADSLNAGLSYETRQGLYAGILMHRCLPSRKWQPTFDALKSAV